MDQSASPPPTAVDSQVESSPTASVDGEEARRLVDGHPLWYHTMELHPGLVTPGWFDLRPIVDQLPWPDVAGKRCLDVGPYDGFLSFELERRGAAEVLAVDIGRHEDWDWPVRLRNRSGSLAELSGPEVGAGFQLAKRLLGSNVSREVISAYDLSPERVGTFDVVICGSLMLHLRDPLRALESIRSVCGGQFMSAEEVTIDLSVFARRRPLAQLNGMDELCQWWVPNVAGHRRMVQAAGFNIVEKARPYAVPFGPAHPKPSRKSLRTTSRRILTRLSVGTGVPHSAVLATA